MNISLSVRAMQETVLITGASGGLGAALAEEFARHGARLLLSGRNEVRLKELAAGLTDRYAADCRVLPADLADPGAPQRLYGLTAGIEVDVLVNNAGFGDINPFAESDPQKDLDMIAVNVTALTELTRLFLPPMLARGRGGILNTASTASFQAMPDWAVYAATKAYVRSFTEALYEENRGSGVRFCALCPGPTATGFEAAASPHGSKLFARTDPAAAVAAFGYRAFAEGRPVAVYGTKNLLETIGCG